MNANNEIVFGFSNIINLQSNYLFILVTVQRTVKLDSSPEVHKYTQTQKHPPTIEMKTNTHTVLNEEK